MGPHRLGQMYLIILSLIVTLLRGEHFFVMGKVTPSNCSFIFLPSGAAHLRWFSCDTAELQVWNNLYCSEVTVFRRSHLFSQSPLTKWTCTGIGQYTMNYLGRFTVKCFISGHQPAFPVGWEMIPDAAPLEPTVYMYLPCYYYFVFCYIHYTQMYHCNYSLENIYYHYSEYRVILFCTVVSFFSNFEYYVQIGHHLCTCTFYCSIYIIIFFGTCSFWSILSLKLPRANNLINTGICRTSTALALWVQVFTQKWVLT